MVEGQKRMKEGKEDESKSCEDGYSTEHFLTHIAAVNKQQGRNSGYLYIL